MISQHHVRRVDLLVTMHIVVVQNVCKHAFGEKPDYSYFNWDEWELRTNEQHRLAAARHNNSNTTSQQKEIERETGVRYSVLLKLPYFYASRMCIIDPMHNLLLGTARHMVLTWKKNLEFRRTQILKRFKR